MTASRTIYVILRHTWVDYEMDEYSTVIAYESEIKAKKRVKRLNTDIKRKNIKNVEYLYESVLYIENYHIK